MDSNPGAKLMTHLVAGYPTMAGSLQVAKALVDGGSSYLEVQFPFSDPCADGVPIQRACSQALLEGFSVDDGFRLIEQIRQYTDTPVFIMSYASIVVARGVSSFVASAANGGTEGLIIPDLTPGYDEGLFDIGKAQGLSIVPVIAPSITADRLASILAADPAYLYASLRLGITGTHTAVNGPIFEFLNKLKGSTVKILAGFGIDSHEQVEALAEYVHALVVGSVLVRKIEEALNGEADVYMMVKEKVHELVGD